jgi:hypothetical protein
MSFVLSRRQVGHVWQHSPQLALIRDHEAVPSQGTREAFVLVTEGQPGSLPHHGVGHELTVGRVRGRVGDQVELQRARLSPRRSPLTLAGGNLAFGAEPHDEPLECRMSVRGGVVREQSTGGEDRSPCELWLVRHS